MAVLAERAFTSRATLQRVESGDPAVGMGIYAAVLHALGFLDGLARLADPASDPVGLALANESLPKRIRIPFLSAMAMLGARDGQPGCYPEMVDVLARHGAGAKRDSHDLLEASAHYFALSLSEARSILKEVATAASSWRAVARDVGAKRKEIDRMASAFEHDALRQALALG